MGFWEAIIGKALHLSGESLDKFFADIKFDNSEMSMQEQLALALSWVEELTAQNQES